MGDWPSIVGRLTSSWVTKGVRVGRLLQPFYSRVFFIQIAHALNWATCTVRGRDFLAKPICDLGANRHEHTIETHIDNHKAIFPSDCWNSINRSVDVVGNPRLTITLRLLVEVCFWICSIKHMLLVCEIDETLEILLFICLRPSKYWIMHQLRRFRKWDWL